MNDKEYCNYLKTRSKFAYLYRKVFLYPRIIKKTQGKVLDFGCGIGDFLSVMPNSTGVDINKYCVDYCNEKDLSAFHIKDSIIPFPDNTFDSVILDNVYEHLSDTNSVMVEVIRVLKSNGIVIVGVPGIKGFTKDSTHIKYYDDVMLAHSLSKYYFKNLGFFYSPLIKSSILSKVLSSYATWGIFRNIK